MGFLQGAGAGVPSSHSMSKGQPIRLEGAAAKHRKLNGFPCLVDDDDDEGKPIRREGAAARDGEVDGIPCLVGNGDTHRPIHRDTPCLEEVLPYSPTRPNGGGDEKNNMGEEEALLSVEDRLSKLDVNVQTIHANELWSRREIQRLQVESSNSKEEMMQMLEGMKVIPILKTRKDNIAAAVGNESFSDTVYKHQISVHPKVFRRERRCANVVPGKRKYGNVTNPNRRRLFYSPTPSLYRWVAQE